MNLMFWLCFAATAYAYLGYLAFLLLYVRLHRRPVRKQPITPTVSVIIAAHNEQANLPAKLENLRQLAYPKDQLQVVIASDGSTDRTAAILHEQEPFVLPVILDQARGKANALNEAVRRATGDILLFLDVRQSVDHNALAELASCFADPEIGAVSGELLLQTPSGQPTGGRARHLLEDREGRAQTRVRIRLRRRSYWSDLPPFAESSTPRFPSAHCSTMSSFP